MARVRILSGNEKGAVVDLPTVEAEAAVDTGYAEHVTESAPAPKEKPPKKVEKFAFEDKQ